ncbi:MAG: sporulation integral membrane protein YtvI [Peptococcaceae bacterium]|jgi:sporulation integral membrane protein YtvI|nr:sporulation integral membrane protein YtvI [Peptococcaceae bacterium]
MDLDRRHPFWRNLNRLIVVTFCLIGLKLCTFFIQEFLPLFGKVVASLVTAFLPFIIALILAVLLEPIVESLIRKLHIRRVLATIMTLILLIAIVGLIIFAVLNRLYTELSDLAIVLPDYAYWLNTFFNNMRALEHLINLNPQIQSAMINAIEGLLVSLQSWAKSSSIVLLGFLGALPGVVIVVIVSVVATILMSFNFPQVKDFLRNLSPRRWQSSVDLVARDLGAALVGFLRAEIMLVSVTAVITILGLMLTGNRYAVTIGVLSGILDLLPIVGTGMLFLPWVAVLCMMGLVGQGMKLLLMWAVIIIVRQMLEPKIMSKSIGLHPLPTLISMYVGLRLLGPVGVIAGPALILVYEALVKAGAFKRKQTPK